MSLNPTNPPWGGSVLRKRLELLDKSPEMKSATSKFFPFLANAFKETDERLKKLEAGGGTGPFPLSGGSS